jgi:hypothetical protein
VAVGRANFRLEWNGPGIERLARESAAAGLNAAAAVLADAMVRNFGKSGGGVVGASASPLAGGPTSGRKKVKGRAKYISSPPGGFPAVRTGNLRNSMAFKRATAVSLVAAAGTNLARSPRVGANGKPLSPNDVDRYALFLEFGTSKMAARPFLLRTLREETPTLRRVFSNAARIRFKRGTGGAKR